MPTDKPLPEANDIIDLTDLVEEGSAGGAPGAEEPPADMSFEQELEDLFGDAEPAAPKKAAATPLLPDEEDLIDLGGMEMVEDEATPAPAAPEAAPPADTEELIDLTDMEFDEPLQETPTPGVATAAAEPAEVEDLMDLTGLEPEAVDEAVPETAAPPMDLTGLAAEEPAVAPVAPAVETFEAISVEDMDIPGLDPQGEGLTSQADMDALLGELPGTPLSGAATDEPLDISDLPGLAALAEEPAPAGAPPPLVQPGQPAPAIDLDALDQIIKTAKGPTPEPEALSEDVLAGLSARLEALEAATAAVTAHLQSLLALPDADTLAARLEQSLDARVSALRDELAPEPGPEPEAAGEALSALRVELLAAIETAKPGVSAPIEELRAALAPDFEALRQGLPLPGQWVAKADLDEAMAATKAEFLAAIAAAKPEPSTLMDDFSGRLESRLADLRQELPGPEAFVTPKGLEQALLELRESLSRDLSAVLETARQAARDEAKAMGEALAARIEALEADRVDPEALTEQVRQAVLPALPDLDAALASAGQAARDEAKAMDEILTARIEALEAGRVDPEALTEQVRQAVLPALPDVPAALTGLRESLSRDLSAVLETARQAAKAAAETMGQSLSERLVPLEAERLDPRALEALVRTEDFQAALTALRAEIAEDIIRRVPQAAAAVIREEIAALAKELE
jgi:predicted component of type VI protein secretion system